MVTEISQTTAYIEFEETTSYYTTIPETHSTIVENGFSEYSEPFPIDIGSFASIDFFSTIAMSKYHLDCPLVCVFHINEDGFICSEIDCLHIPADNNGGNYDITMPLLDRLDKCVKRPGKSVILTFTTNRFREQFNGATDTLSLIQGMMNDETSIIEVPIELIYPEENQDNSRVDYIIGEGAISAFQNVAFGRYELIASYPISSLLSC